MLKGKVSQLLHRSAVPVQALFHVILDRLEIRRFKEHSFFCFPSTAAAILADFGAHRWELFAAVKSEYSISRALLVEANPKLAESLKETFSKESDVLHAAVVGANNKGAVTFTQSTNPESSSIFREWSAAYGIADQVDVPTIDLSSNSEVGETSGLGKV